VLVLDARAVGEQEDGQMPVRSVWHAGFTVDDIEASIAFWTDAVGMVLRHRQIQENEYTSLLVGFPDVRLSVAQLRLPEGGYGASGHVIELIEYQRPAGHRVEPDNAAIGSGHIALEVDDIEATRERCERMGATFLSRTLDITAGINRGGKAVYGRAPDGITFELVQPPQVLGTPSPDAPG
jgi:catechol 2,3-dioxygenase-like lactoylglutathione lyase family enzyme